MIRALVRACISRLLSRSIKGVCGLSPPGTQLPELWSSLSVQDPRKGQIRQLLTADGSRISNAELGVAIIELDNYALLTDTETIAAIIDSACCSYGVCKLVISIEPALEILGCDDVFLWKIVSKNRSVASYCLEGPFLFRLRRILEANANWGKWSFGAMTTDEFALPMKIKSITPSFDSAITNSSLWKFMITLDLDGILLGYLQASTDLDAFLDRLKKRGESR